MLVVLHYDRVPGYLEEHTLQQLETVFTFQSVFVGREIAVWKIGFNGVNVSCHDKTFSCSDNFLYLFFLLHIIAYPLSR